MSVGMLWFCEGVKTLLQHMQQAAAYYQKKYEKTAELILVHPNMLKDQKLEELQSATGLTIRPYRPVLPGHIWIGREDKSEITPNTEKAESPL